MHRASAHLPLTTIKPSEQVPPAYAITTSHFVCKWDKTILCYRCVSILQTDWSQVQRNPKDCICHCTKSALRVQRHPKEFLLPLYKKPITGSAYPQKTIIAIVQKAHYRFNVTAMTVYFHSTESTSQDRRAQYLVHCLPLHMKQAVLPF